MNKSPQHSVALGTAAAMERLPAYGQSTLSKQ